MRPLRRLLLVLVLALTLVAGQQLVLWHDLRHAGEIAAGEAGGEGGHGGLPAKCEQHYTCAQLSGALASIGFAVAFVASTPPRAAAQRIREACLAPRLAFLSRAPPISLA